MSRTNGSDLVRVLLAASEAVRLQELGGALAELRRVIGCSGVLLYRYGDRGEGQWVAGDLVAAAPMYSRDLFDEDPIHAAKRGFAPDVRVIHATKLLDPQRYRRTAAYADFYRPNSLEHLVCTWLTPTRYGDPGMVGLLLARPQNAGDFSKRDLCWLSSVLPAFTAAVGRSTRIEASERARCAAETILCADQPYLAFDRRGTLVWASPRAEQLLGSALAHGGRGLPDTLSAEVRRLGALAFGIEPASLPRLELDLAIGGRRLRADVFISRAQQGEPFIACALRAEEAEKALDPALAARFGLSPAEGRVLSLLALGLSNEEIGKRLFVSIETVRTHVKRILGKLGVQSRMHAALLVRDPPATTIRAGRS